MRAWLSKPERSLADFEALTGFEDPGLATIVLRYTPELSPPLRAWCAADPALWPRLAAARKLAPTDVPDVLRAGMAHLLTVGLEPTRYKTLRRGVDRLLARGQALPKGVERDVLAQLVQPDRQFEYTDVYALDALLHAARGDGPTLQRLFGAVRAQGRPQFLKRFVLLPNCPLNLVREALMASDHHIAVRRAAAVRADVQQDDQIRTLLLGRGQDTHVLLPLLKSARDATETRAIFLRIARHHLNIALEMLAEGETPMTALTTDDWGAIFDRAAKKEPAKTAELLARGAWPSLLQLTPERLLPLLRTNDRTTRTYAIAATSALPDAASRAPQPEKTLRAPVRRQ